MQEMLSKDFLPAVSRFAGEVSKSVLDKKALLPSIKAEKETGSRGISYRCL